MRVLQHELLDGTNTLSHERVLARRADASYVLQRRNVLGVHEHRRGRHALHDVPQSDGVGEGGVRFHEFFPHDVLVDVGEFVRGKRDFRAQKEQRVEKVPARHLYVVTSALVFEHELVAAEAVVRDEHGLGSDPLRELGESGFERHGVMFLEICVGDVHAPFVRFLVGGHVHDCLKRSAVDFNGADVPYVAVGRAVVDVADKLKVYEHVVVGGYG
mgnify:CR=1 FL=1